MKLSGVRCETGLFFAVDEERMKDEKNASDT